MDAYWLVSLSTDAQGEASIEQCLVRVSTSDILRDISRGPASLIRKHFCRNGDLPGYIADHLETVRRVIACEVVAPIYLSGFAAGTGSWKWSEAMQIAGFQETAGPSGTIGDFPVWQWRPSPLARQSAGRWRAFADAAPQGFAACGAHR